MIYDHISCMSKGRHLSHSRIIFLAPRSNTFSCFMCHHLLKCIWLLMLFHFWIITFLFSGLFFPEFLIARIFDCFLFSVWTKKARSLPSCSNDLVFYSFYVFLGISSILLEEFLLGTH